MAPAIHAVQQLVAQDEIRVLARQAHGLTALTVDGRRDFLVDAPGEDHFDDLDGRTIRDAQAVDEVALDGESLEHRADLWPAAMHDDGMHAALFHQRNVAGEIGQRIRVAHGMATQLDDHGLAVVLLQVGQGDGQGACGGDHVAGVGFIGHGLRHNDCGNGVQRAAALRPSPRNRNCLGAGALSIPSGRI